MTIYILSMESACIESSYFPNAFAGKALSLSSSVFGLIFSGLRLISATMPVQSNSFRAIISISLPPLRSHQLPAIVNAPDSIALAWKYCSNVLPENFS